MRIDRRLFCGGDDVADTDDLVCLVVARMARGMPDLMPHHVIAAFLLSEPPGERPLARCPETARKLARLRNRNHEAQPVTRQRVQQIEERALRKLKRIPGALDILREYVAMRATERTGPAYPDAPSEYW